MLLLMSKKIILSIDLFFTTSSPDPVSLEFINIDPCLILLSHSSATYAVPGWSHLYILKPGLTGLNLSQQNSAIRAPE